MSRAVKVEEEVNGGEGCGGGDVGEDVDERSEAKRDGRGSGSDVIASAGQSGYGEVEVLEGGVLGEVEEDVVC